MTPPMCSIDGVINLIFHAAIYLRVVFTDALTSLSLVVQ